MNFANPTPNKGGPPRPDVPSPPILNRLEISGNYNGLEATYDSPVLIGSIRIDTTQYVPNLKVRHNRYIRPGVIGTYVIPQQQCVITDSNQWFVKVNSLPVGNYFFDAILSQTALPNAPRKGTSPRFSNPSVRRNLIVNPQNEGLPQIVLYSRSTNYFKSPGNYYQLSTVTWQVFNATKLSCIGFRSQTVNRGVGPIENFENFSNTNLSVGVNDGKLANIILKPKEFSSPGLYNIGCTFEVENSFGKIIKECTQTLKVVGNPW